MAASDLVWRFAASVVGGVLGYLNGAAFLYGRSVRTGGQAAPDERIPYMVGALYALSFPLYTAKLVGVV